MLNIFPEIVLYYPIMCSASIIILLLVLLLCIFINTINVYFRVGILKKIGGSLYAIWKPTFILLILFIIFRSTLGYNQAIGLYALGVQNLEKGNISLAERHFNIALELGVDSEYRCKIYLYKDVIKRFKKEIKEIKEDG